MSSRDSTKQEKYPYNWKFVTSYPTQQGWSPPQSFSDCATQLQKACHEELDGYPNTFAAGVLK